MPLENKPYLWLDRDNNQLKIKIWSGTYRLAHNVAEQQSDGDTLRLVYTLSDTGAFPLETVFDFSDPLSEYNPSTHIRITVVLKDDHDNILGHCTVKPAIGTFETINYDPPSADIFPYLYVQFRDTDVATVHVAAFISGGSVLVEGRPEDNYDIYERKVDFSFDANDSVMNYIEEDHLLDYSTDFDPVLDNIVISLTENDSSGLRRKGTGTIHTSEADASSGG